MRCLRARRATPDDGVTLFREFLSGQRDLKQLQCLLVVLALARDGIPRSAWALIGQPVGGSARRTVVRGGGESSPLMGGATPGAETPGQDAPLRTPSTKWGALSATVMHGGGGDAAASRRSEFLSRMRAAGAAAGGGAADPASPTAVASASPSTAAVSGAAREPDANEPATPMAGPSRGAAVAATLSRTTVAALPGTTAVPQPRHGNEAGTAAMRAVITPITAATAMPSSTSGVGAVLSPLVAASGPPGADAAPEPLRAARLAPMSALTLLTRGLSRGVAASTRVLQSLVRAALAGARTSDGFAFAAR